MELKAEERERKKSSYPKMYLCMYRPIGIDPGDSIQRARLSKGWVYIPQAGAMVE